MGARTDDDGPSPVLKWALWYARAGLSVVPVAVGEKFPSVAWAEFQTRRATEAEIRAWWGGLYASCGVGFVTGPISNNVIAIDADVHKQGLENFEDLLVMHEDLPPTWTARSGGGGRHFILRAPAGVRIRNSSDVLGPGIDVRGEGGFLVLPPTIHPNGHPYEWTPGLEPETTAIGPMSRWLVDLLEGVDDPQPSIPRGESPKRSSGVPSANFNPFGRRLDGREVYMRDLLWSRLLHERRKSAVLTNTVFERVLAETWAVFERRCKARTGTLASEGRGIEEMRRKLGYAVRKWDTRLYLEASQPRIKNWDEEASGQDRPAGGQDKPDASAPASGQTDQDGQEFGGRSGSGTGGSKPEPEPATPLILTARQFVAGFTPPEFLVDGVLQRGYLYSLTARTNHGKTVVSLYLAQCVARGVQFAGREVLAGSVLFLAGENPDDIRARVLVMAERHGFDAKAIPIHFIAGVVDLVDAMPRIMRETRGIADLRLVVVDTAQAYYPGDDPNNNAQQAAYARMLRQLTFLPGLPACVVNGHPIKNAARDNLLPAGGGAYLNEVDGNLTLWSGQEGQTELYWQGKFRGPEFDPVAFRMESATCDTVRDSKNKLMPSVVALPMGDMELSRKARETEDNDNAVLRCIAENQKITTREIAAKLGWITADGKPQHQRVARCIMRLRDDGFVQRKNPRGRLRVTAAGKAELAGQEEED